MRDPTSARNRIVEILSAIVGPLPLVGAAEGSWWTAWEAPVLIGLAGGAAAGAGAMCAAAIGTLNAFCTCAAGSPACAGPCASLRAIIWIEDIPDAPYPSTPALTIKAARAWQQDQRSAQLTHNTIALCASVDRSGANT
jgi:hypothetical protein